MTQPAVTPDPGIAQLRKALVSADDDTLRAFLHGYSLGIVTDFLISTMNAQNQRVEFLTAIAKAYPDDWQQAVKDAQV